MLKYKIFETIVTEKVTTSLLNENKKESFRLCKDHLSSMEHLIIMISTSIVRKCVHE